ncbi:carboxypeptidase-like regulatory domain-containing protein [Flavobacterium enshiense]|uniref:carboxypeptidase-like regulatory domain-containing protein n=1 Tax=Flavobacterium enshiense TaxID=1341165 RepID=UPI00345DC913
MKKYFLFLFVFICVTTITAQEKTIRVRLQNAVTKEPVQSASIVVNGSSLGTISNDDGDFQLTVLKPSEISITHLGYRTKAISSEDCSDKGSVVLLDPNEQMLEEVIVTKSPIHEVLAKVIAISKEKFNKPIVLNSYYREFVKVNDKYTRFTDGLLEYHISGTTKKTKSDLIVNQSRAAKLITDDDDTKDIASGLDVRLGVRRQYDFYTIEKILFDDKNYEDYEFEIKSRMEKSGVEMYVISFQPKATLEKFLYKGVIAYDPATNLISDFEIYSDLDNLKYSKVINILIVKAMLLDMRVKTSFKISNGNYVMAFSSKKGKIKVWNKRKFDEVVEYKSDLVVTDHKKEDFSYNPKSVYDDRSLYKRGNNYETKFWQNTGAVVLTAEETKIISELEKESKVN